MKTFMQKLHNIVLGRTSSQIFETSDLLDKVFMDKQL